MTTELLSDVYLSALPPRVEAILGGVRHGVATGDRVTRSACTSMEAPSSIVAARLLAPDLEVSFGEVPQPDPRVPFRSVKCSLWTYLGETAMPAVEPPEARVQDAVVELAVSDFDLDIWSEWAVDAAKTADHATPSSVLGAMVNVPRGPEDQDPGDWIFRYQVATALVVSRIKGGRERAEGCVTELMDIVCGAVDWTSTAALVGLVAVARRSDGQSSLISEFMFEMLRRPVNPIWFMCVHEPAWFCLQHVPGLSVDARALVEQGVRQLLAEQLEE